MAMLQPQRSTIHGSGADTWSFRQIVSSRQCVLNGCRLYSTCVSIQMVLCPTAGCCRGGRVARREVALIVVIKSTAFPRVVVLALVARPLVVAPLPLGTRGRATLDLRPLRLALRVVPLPLSLLPPPLAVKE